MRELWIILLFVLCFCFSFILMQKSGHVFCFLLFVFFFNIDEEFFCKMVLALTAQHNVHRQPIIQVLTMIILMIFDGFNHKGEKYNLLILMVTMEFELSKIMLLHHKILHSLINSKIFHYIQISNAIIQLNFILFKRNINYHSKIVQHKETVQSMRVMIIKFSGIVFHMKKKRRKKKEHVKGHCQYINVNQSALNDINIGCSPDMIHDSSSNSGISNIAGVETESQPPVLIHPVSNEAQTFKENEAKSYLITGVSGAFLNSNQIAIDIGKGIRGTL